MSINFNTPKTLTLGNNKGAAGMGDKPKAQFWINVGYEVQVQAGDQVETRFVSLATGIPVDTQEKLATNSRNAEYAAFQHARNNLHDQIMEAAAALSPGEERMLNLQIQLRRVNDEMAPAEGNDNLFIKPLSL